MTPASVLNETIKDYLGNAAETFDAPSFPIRDWPDETQLPADLVAYTDDTPWLIELQGTATSSLIENDAEEEQIAQLFSSLANRWYHETGMYSLEIQKVAHPSYLQIIGMGKQALPYLLRELEAHGGQWYQALEAILKETPVDVSDDPGNMPLLRERWLEWARQANVINLGDEPGVFLGWLDGGQQPSFIEVSPWS